MVEDTWTQILFTQRQIKLCCTQFSFSIRNAGHLYVIALQSVQLRRRLQHTYKRNKCPMMLFVCYTPKFPENPEPNRTNRDLGRCCSVSSRSIGCSSRFGLGGQQGARSRSRSQPRSKKPDRYRFEAPNRYRAPSSLGSFAGLSTGGKEETWSQESSQSKAMD